MNGHAGDSLFEMEDGGQAGGHIIRVAFESGVDSEFDYIVPDKLWPVAVGPRIEPLRKIEQARNRLLR